MHEEVCFVETSVTGNNSAFCLVNSAISYLNVNEHFIQNRDLHVMHVTFTYRFGKQFKDAPGKNNGGATDGQIRVKPGG